MNVYPHLPTVLVGVAIFGHLALRIHLLHLPAAAFGAEATTSVSHALVARP
jgi:hypothetical protein